MEHEGDGVTNCNWCTWNNPQRIRNGTGRLGNKRTTGDHPYNSIIKIGKDSEKSPRGLRRLEVTQIPMENHLLTLVQKKFSNEGRKTQPWHRQTIKNLSHDPENMDNGMSENVQYISK